MGNYWRRPLGAKLILLLAVAFLLAMLAPWQRICAVTSEAGERTCGWRTAYEGSQFGTYMALLALAIVIWELLPVIWPRLSMRGWPTATITAVLGVALVVATLVKMIDDNEFQTVWAWIGLAIALAIMFLALIRVRYRWGTRGREEPVDDVPRAVSAPPPPLATGESREPPPE
jgi:amino acid transporter